MENCQTVLKYITEETAKQTMTLNMLKYFLPFLGGSLVAIISLGNASYFSSFALLYKVNREHSNQQIHCLMFEHKGHNKAEDFLIQLLASGQSSFDVYIFNPFKKCTLEHNLRTKHFIPSVIRTALLLALTLTK